jgi:hypothetical protein
MASAAEPGADTPPTMSTGVVVLADLRPGGVVRKVVWSNVPSGAPPAAAR